MFEYANPRATTLAQLKSRGSLITMEALSVHKPLSGTVDKLTSFLEDVTNTISQSLASLKDYATGTTTAMTTQDKHVIDRLDRAQYTHLMSLNLPCVPGLTATWLEFLAALDQPMHMVTTINDEILIPYEKYLSLAMTDPERFSNATNRVKAPVIDFTPMRKGFEATVGGNRHIAMRHYKDLCKRNVDLAEVIRLTRQYQTAAAKTNPRLIADRIKDLRDLTSRLAENIQDPNQSFRLASKTISGIADSSYNIAEAIEMYATTMTFLESHVQSFNEAEKKLYRAM